MDSSLRVSPLNFVCYAHRKIGGMCDENGFRQNHYDGTRGRVLTASSTRSAANLDSVAISQRGASRAASEVGSRSASEVGSLYGGESSVRGSSAYSRRSRGRSLS